MKYNKLMMTFAVLVVVFSAAFAQVSQQIGNGNVDWGGQIIRATGIGAPNPNMPVQAARAGALRAAKLMAARNLLEIVKGINLTAETTVENSMVSNDIIVTRVEGIVRNFYQVGQPRYMSTGDVEVTIEMKLTGDLSDVLLQPDQFGGGQYQVGAATSNGVFTGLIVDVRGLGLRPAMAPKILDDAGNEVYGSRYVSRDWAVKIGMVGYERDINRATTNDRVTNNPLVVKAIKVAGQNKADVVVSSADAGRIHAAAQNMNFLDKCKVMFIVD